MKKIIIAMIRGYKRYISPSMPPCCRFRPTCSEYAIEAVTEWGSAKGICLALWRVIRCNPLCKGGYDPVPLRHNTVGR